MTLEDRGFSQMGIKEMRNALYLGLAYGFLYRGEYRRAASLLERLCVGNDEHFNRLGSDPVEADASTFMYLGHCYYQMGLYRKSVETFAHAHDAYRISYGMRSDWRQDTIEFLNAFAHSLKAIGEREKAFEIEREVMTFTSENLRSDEAH